MNLHANAKLGLAGQRELVIAVERGMTLKQAGACFGVSPATVHRWWHRWCNGGRVGEALPDRRAPRAFDDLEGALPGLARVSDFLCVRAVGLRSEF
jgi:transposase-like protein